MKTLVGMAVWLLMGTAWAETTLETTGPVDASLLTNAMKAAVPALEGLDLDTEGAPGRTRITIRRLTGEFLESERGALRAVLAQHDPVREAQAASDVRARAAGDLAAAKARLITLGLTADEAEALVSR